MLLASTSHSRPGPMTLTSSRDSPAARQAFVDVNLPRWRTLFQDLIRVPNYFQEEHAAILRFEGAGCTINSLLMSCRVLGRRIEEAFLQEILAEAGWRGAAWVEGQFIPTEKNALVADFYVRMGFAPQPPADAVTR